MMMEATISSAYKMQNDLQQIYDCVIMMHNAIRSCMVQGIEEKSLTQEQVDIILQELNQYQSLASQIKKLSINLQTHINKKEQVIFLENIVSELVEITKMTIELNLKYNLCWQ